MKANPRRLDPAIYPYWMEVATRFSDVDPQHHLNNVRLMEYYQEARISFHLALRTQYDFERAHGSRTLVAHQSVDYLAEVKHPGVVAIGVGVLRIGATSYALGLGMFQADRCVGLAMAVLVHGNQEGPAALPQAWREILQARVLPADALA